MEHDIVQQYKFRDVNIKDAEFITAEQIKLIQSNEIGFIHMDANYEYKLYKNLDNLLSEQGASFGYIHCVRSMPKPQNPIWHYDITKQKVEPVNPLQFEKILTLNYVRK